MAKHEVIFVCSNCGEEYLKWEGKCSNCGQWNTLKEFKKPQARFSGRDRISAEPIELSKISTRNFKRLSTQISEFDRVLGGGIIPGTIILLGGDPGIGKSTLLLQLAGKIDKVLYISGEESAEQIKIRFDRLGLTSKSLKVLPETDLGAILEKVKQEQPELIIVDSIQTIYSSEFPSTPGSIVQVRESALILQQLAKTSRTPVILVGHVTKEGSVAGPRILEHLVDVVLYLEGERFHENRILRGAKNRFGATDEIGIFEMTEKGLTEVKNPSKLFLAERLKNIPGTIVTATVEGTRAFLVEVQALTSQALFGYPQRRASGFDLNRLQILLAVLQKRAGIVLSDKDVFLNIVGGIKIKEPAIDLAVALAIAGVYKNKIINSKICAFGEIGLSGEIRQVSSYQKREAEAKRLGFEIFPQVKTLAEAIRRYCV